MRRVTRDRITARTREVKRFAERLPREMHQVFVENTPIRTGNARNSTKLQGDNIVADYNYATALEVDGRSNQAPKGMSEPTIEWVRAELRKLN